MAKRKRTTPRRRPRTARRRFKRRVRRRLRRRAPRRLPTSGFPKSKIVKLRYVERISVDPGFGDFTKYDFSCNSVYDPNVTGIGHQPLGRDQWAGLYRSYDVIRSDITVHCVPAGTANSIADPYILATEVDDTTDVDYDPTHFIEQGVGRYRIIHGQYGSKAVLRTRWTKKKAYRGMAAHADQNYGSTGGDPTKRYYYHLLFAGLNATADPNAVSCLVVINYTVRWFDKNDIAQS